MAQLEADMGCLDIDLTAELLSGLEDIHKRYTYPCP